MLTRAFSTSQPVVRSAVRRAGLRAVRHAKAMRHVTRTVAMIKRAVRPKIDSAIASVLALGTTHHMKTYQTCHAKL